MSPVDFKKMAMSPVSIFFKNSLLILRTTVMRDVFTKVKISLVLMVVHICVMHPLKAQTFVYLMMSGRILTHLIKK